jgi:hypothetical protein
MCSVGLAGLAVAAAGTAATMYQQQQVASQNNDAIEAANQQRTQERTAELARQDEIRQKRGEVAAVNLDAVSAAGNAKTQADAEAARLAQAGTVPTTVGESDVPQIYTNPGAITGGIVTGDVAKGLGEARERLAANARLDAYGDVGQEEKRMRSLSASAFDALSSMSKGSLGVYGSETAQKPVLDTADTSLGQGGILVGNYLSANPNSVKNLITGDTSNTQKLAEQLNSRLLSGSGAAQPATPYTG